MYICALTIHSSKFVSSSGVFEHGCEKSQWHDDITQWRNVTSMEGNESLWHFLLRVTRLRIFCLAARPRRISRWCLRFIDSNRLLTETERERRSKGEKKKKITWPVTRIVNHALYFPAYNRAVPEVKIHRWALSLRMPWDNITRHLLHSLWYSYIPVVNDNSILCCHMFSIHLLFLFFLN